MKNTVAQKLFFFCEVCLDLSKAFDTVDHYILSCVTLLLAHYSFWLCILFWNIGAKQVEKWCVDIPPTFKPILQQISLLQVAESRE